MITRRRTGRPPRDARGAALAILEDVRSGAPFDAALDRHLAPLAEDDRRLAHELAAGVLRERGPLDLLLAPLATRGWDAVAPTLQDVLRLGAYQLARLDRIPPHAAVGETVELARRAVNDKASGFVNAVLRKLATRGVRLPRLEGDARPTSDRNADDATSAAGMRRTDDERSAEHGVRESADALGARIGRSHPRTAAEPSLFAIVADDEPSETPDETITRLSQSYSHPDWLVRRWLARFGAPATERLLRWNNSRPALVLQPARADYDTLLARLRDAGVPVEPAPFGAGIVVRKGRPDQLRGYAEGDFLVQDPAQALVAWFADVPPGATVYDTCAAPGGKALATGRTAGRVIAADLRPDKLPRLAENLRRAGSGRERLLAADAEHPPIRDGSVDVAHVDAPCLGTGTFARHPDARHRVTEAALAELTAVQARILDAAARTVRPGGWLVYSTCTLEPEENGRQVDAFLARHPDFRRDPNPDLPSALLTPEGDLALLPHRHATDGAYCARLRRDG
jgi:16S rRNA (cytosine967-C5)-methyltransferase